MEVQPRLTTSRLLQKLDCRGNSWCGLHRVSPLQSKIAVGAHREGGRRTRKKTAAGNHRCKTALHGAGRGRYAGRLPAEETTTWRPTLMPGSQRIRGASTRWSRTSSAGKLRYRSS